jgi:hypothetical protein
VAFHEFQRKSRHEFKRFDPVPKAGSHSCQQRYGTSCLPQGDEQGGRLPRERVQPESGCGDDSQCALTANEQLLEIVTGCVLVERTQAVDDAAIRQHDLEAEDLLSRRAVSNDIYAPGVGRQVTADLATPFCAETQGEVAINGTRLLLQVREDTARLRDHRKVLGVDRTDSVQARKRQDQLFPGLVRYRSTTQAGIPPLRHDRDASATAQPDHVRNLRGSAGRDHGECSPMEYVSPFGYVRFECLLISQAGAFPDNFDEFRQNALSLRQ